MGAAQIEACPLCAARRVASGYSESQQGEVEQPDMVVGCPVAQLHLLEYHLDGVLA